MWLTCDVGNSAVKFGLFEDERLDHTFSSTHEPASLGPALEAELDTHPVERAGIASVVPKTGTSLERILSDRGIEITVIGPEMPLPFELAYETPRTLGTDRLAAAAAAWILFGREEDGRPRNVIALDAGTAVTCEVIRRDGVYLGGTIGPGPALMLRSLNRDTAQLPEVPLELPDAVVGRSTRSAMQAGVMLAYVEGIRGLLGRIEDELGEGAFVVATGGWRELLRREIPEIAAVEPHLVLKGIRMLIGSGFRVQGSGLT